MFEIIVLNRFRDDCVLVTHQDSFGNMDSMAVDFPKIQDRDEQFAIALAEALRWVKENWKAEIVEMREKNERNICEEEELWYAKNMPSFDETPDDPADWPCLREDDGYNILDDICTENQIEIEEDE